MSDRLFQLAMIALALAFTVFFGLYVAPPVILSGDLYAAFFVDGFVNTAAAGYSTDTLMCWLVLVLWMVHESRTRRVRGAWVCALLGIVPGVVVGFALYLVLRSRAEATAVSSGG